MSSLAVACLGRGGVCGAVADVPFSALRSPHNLQTALRALGWVTRCEGGEHVEIRCPVCLEAERAAARTAQAERAKIR